MATPEPNATHEPNATPEPATTLGLRATPGLSATAEPYGRRLNAVASADPDRLALWFAPLAGAVQSHTMAELDRRSSQLALTFESCGVGVDDRVGLEMANSPALLVCFLAAWKLGATPVPIRWDLPAWERNRLLKVLSPRLVIANDSSLLERNRSEPADPLDDVVRRYAFGICSSGEHRQSQGDHGRAPLALRPGDIGPTGRPVGTGE